MENYIYSEVHVWYKLRLLDARSHPLISDDTTSLHCHLFKNKTDSHSWGGGVFMTGTCDSLVWYSSSTALVLVPGLTSRPTKLHVLVTSLLFSKPSISAETC